MGKGSFMYAWVLDKAKHECDAASDISLWRFEAGVYFVTYYRWPGTCDQQHHGRHTSGRLAS